MPSSMSHNFKFIQIYFLYCLTSLLTTWGWIQSLKHKEGIYLVKGHHPSSDTQVFIISFTTLRNQFKFFCGNPHGHVKNTLRIKLRTLELWGRNTTCCSIMLLAWRNNDLDFSWLWSESSKPSINSLLVVFFFRTMAFVFLFLSFD